MYLIQRCVITLMAHIQCPWSAKKKKKVKVEKYGFVLSQKKSVLSLSKNKSVLPY